MFRRAITGYGVRGKQKTENTIYKLLSMDLYEICSKTELRSCNWVDVRKNKPTKNLQNLESFCLHVRVLINRLGKQCFDVNTEAILTV